MTAKIDRYIQNKINGMNKKDAAIKAGYSPSCANAAKGRIESTEAYQRAVDKYISESRLYEALNDGLSATTTKIATNNGEITDEKEYPDYNARCKYVDIALRLRGDYEATKQDVTVSDISLVKSEVVDLIKRNGFDTPNQ